jgi:phosphinothricin acetyltransferase
MSNTIVRPAHRDDLEAVLGIYNWAVAHTTATMDTDPRSHAAQIEWLELHDGNPYPALVAEVPDESAGVVGFASLSPYIRRPGYKATAEVSLYVHPDWQRQGVGNALMTALLSEAKCRQFVVLLSLITADNEASLRLHERHGFAIAGTLRRVGRKFDQWVDVTFVQRLLEES